MKKIISLLTLLFLVVSRIFASEYIYWDDIAAAVDNYVAMFHLLRKDKSVE